MKKKKQFLLWVFIAMILGVLAGVFTKEKIIFGINFFVIYKTIGSLFINALMLIVTPLIASSIISGFSRFKAGKDLQNLTMKTIGIFLAFNLLAILFGVILFEISKPLLEHSSGVMREFFLANQAGVSVAKNSLTISSFFSNLLPTNILDIFSGKHMLGLIIFSLVFGFSISKVESFGSSTIKKLSQDLFHVMIYITNLLMKILPLGVFCLIAQSVASIGIESLKPLSIFLLCSIIGILLFGFLLLPIIIRITTKANPFYFMRAMSSALITAFSTSSSSATLPVTLNCLENKVGLSNKTTSFIIPLATTLNMAASAFYVYFSVMFLSIIYGIEIDLSTHIFIVVLTFFSTLGVAGVPSAAIVAIIIISKSIAIPINAIGILLAIDRFIDMFRASTNVFTGSVSALIVAKSLGEKHILSKKLIKEQ
jgi:proton glutamate symport protein